MNFYSIEKYKFSIDHIGDRSNLVNIIDYYKNSVQDFFFSPYGSEFTTQAINITENKKKINIALSSINFTSYSDSVKYSFTLARNQTKDFELAFKYLAYIKTK